MSDLGSPLYGQHLTPEEVCRVTSCDDRAEGIREVLHWVLGDAAEGLWASGALGWEEGRWLNAPDGGDGGDGDDDDVMAKVRVDWLVCFLVGFAGVFVGFCWARRNWIVIALCL